MRYTAVFTGLLDLKKPGEYPYLVMDGEGNGVVRRGRPPYDRMGVEIRFDQLPEAPRTLVLTHYRIVWNLAGSGPTQEAAGRRA
jgi:hypothetical protein